MEADLITSGLKTFAMLLVVLGILILVLTLLRRFLFARTTRHSGAPIQILSSLHLSAKERVVVLETAGERLVLGVCPGQIRLLSKLSADGERQAEVNEKSLEPKN